MAKKKKPSNTTLRCNVNKIRDVRIINEVLDNGPKNSNKPLSNFLNKIT